MAIRQPSDDPFATLLEGARRQVGIPRDKLWVRYQMVGGTKGVDAFNDWFRGDSHPAAEDYNFVALALEPLLIERGQRPLPVIFRLAPRGNGATSPGEDDTIAPLRAVA